MAQECRGNRIHLVKRQDEKVSRHILQRRAELHRLDKIYDPCFKRKHRLALAERRRRSGNRISLDSVKALPGNSGKATSFSAQEQLVSAAGDLPWEQSEAVGEGEEYRAESDRGDHASALAFEETVEHGSVVSAM